MYAGTERRTDHERRLLINQMSREEMIAELLTDTLSGVGSRRAYEERKQRKTIYALFVDVDGLKWVNDNWGHHAGDALIRCVGKTLQDMGCEVFRIGGDEFAICFNTFAEVSKFILLAEVTVAGQSFGWSGTDGWPMEALGARITIGVGNSEEKADAMLKTMKGVRATLGIRAKRGDSPPGLHLINNRVNRLNGGLRSVLAGV